VLRFDNVDTYALNGQALPAPTVISAAFPSDASHGWKYIAFGPDDKLYVPVGAPCNICELQVRTTFNT
jgi:glucose/arabinose dehydrogenase